MTAIAVSRESGLKICRGNFQLNRESSGGKYGATGFKWVFKLRDRFLVMGGRVDIYLKGFFFEEDDPRGIEIQSFKKSVILKKIK